MDCHPGHRSRAPCRVAVCATDTEFFTGKKTGPPAGQAPAGANQRLVRQPTPLERRHHPGGCSLSGRRRASFRFQLPKRYVERGHETLRHFLHGLSRSDRQRRRHDRATRFPAGQHRFMTDRLRQAPVGHFFDAITNGWGAMPSYAPQIPVQDRWAIIAYIRALQLSQDHATPAATVATAANTGGHASFRRAEVNDRLRRPSRSRHAATARADCWRGVSGCCSWPERFSTTNSSFIHT